MSTTKILSLAAAWVCATAVSIAVAQPPVVPIEEDLSTKAFTIRVVNGGSTPLYYKIVGGPGKSFVHQTLQPGQSETETASGGEKVLAVWDLAGHVTGMGLLVVNKSGKIVLGAEPEETTAPPPAGASAPAAAARSPRLPSIRIVPEGRSN